MVGLLGEWSVKLNESFSQQQQQQFQQQKQQSKCDDGSFTPFGMETVVGDMRDRQAKMVQVWYLLDVNYSTITVNSVYF